jgi:hypothetical protein
MATALATPLEWLITLSAAGALERFVREVGSLHHAAWLLARARCATREHATLVPSAGEVRGAAREIAGKLGQPDVPSLSCLARDCEAAGLPVI